MSLRMTLALTSSARGEKRSGVVRPKRIKYQPAVKFNSTKEITKIPSMTGLIDVFQPGGVLFAAVDIWDIEVAPEVSRRRNEKEDIYPVAEAPQQPRLRGE